jgi:hypothetical protein
MTTKKNFHKILRPEEFKFEYEVDGVKTTLFERNDSIEIETFEGKIDTASFDGLATANMY